jgi:2-polyprenyl-3-methyl-5-hydroxy-6-metoxy-1,4-benzoquinol methylase
VDGAFDQLLCSQVIEHVEAGDQPFREMARVLKAGGRLVLGTPDYGRRAWVIIERLYKLAAPGAYADQHITHYDRDTLTHKLESLGFQPQEAHYVLGAELIASFAKLG